MENEESSSLSGSNIKGFKREKSQVQGMVRASTLLMQQRKAYLNKQTQN
jgi:hypothetical protein